MARPRRDQQYRVPTWHAGRKCWRLRIEHHHGEKTFEWSAPSETAQCPPHIIAAAVAEQDQWKKLRADWSSLAFYFSVQNPQKDWTRPVWVTADQIDAAKAHVESVRGENRRRLEVTTAHTAAHIGIDRLTDVLSRLEPGSAENPGGPWENERLAILAALRPARQAFKTATAREALKAYLAYHEGRTKLKAGDWIEETTYRQLRKTLLAAFGLSSGEKMEPVRTDVPLDLDKPLAMLDDDTLDGFARFWHGMPAGVSSPRTIRNRLGAAREFFNWCARREYGFKFSHDIAKVFTAEDVETPAKPYDPEQINRILKQGKTRGRHRLKIYTMLGVICGYPRRRLGRQAPAGYRSRHGRGASGDGRV